MWMKKGRGSEVRSEWQWQWEKETITTWSWALEFCGARRVRESKTFYASCDNNRHKKWKRSMLVVFMSVSESIQKIFFKS